MSSPPSDPPKPPQSGGLVESVSPRRDSATMGVVRPLRTMPPPELLDRPPPASVGSLVLQGGRSVAPISRHQGPRAEEALLRARVADHRAAANAEGEREASTQLARLLASRGTDLDTATMLARRALALGDDPALRAELSGWLAGLGEPALAAAALRPLCDPARSGGAPEAAQTLVRVAVLLARASDPAGAADALDEAAALDPSDALPCELKGTLAAWAPEEVTPEAAAAAYLEAVARREAAKDKEAAFEDRLRASEIAPASDAAAHSLAAALVSRDRTGAADEVLRAHALAVTALDPARGRAAHWARVLTALGEGDFARGIGAVLDAGFEADVDAEGANKVDDLLSQAGLYELFALRLELRAERSVGAARSEHYQAVAQLYAGPLASPDRAVEAWIEAASSDPSNETARAALRDHAGHTHDHAPLAEALVRIGLGPEGSGPSAGARAAALRELAALADEKLADASLATWALERLAASGVDAEGTKGSMQRLGARARVQDEALAAALRLADGAESPEAHLDATRKLAAAYRSRPDDAERHRVVLAALARRLPAERSYALSLERLCWRQAPEAGASQRVAELDALMGERIASPNLPRVELVRARLARSAIARRRGDDATALAEVLPLLFEAPGHRGAASAALLLATRLGRETERASALVQLAGPVPHALRAVLLAVAAELELALGNQDGARKAAELACEADPSSARAIASVSAVHSARRDRVAAAAIERAMGVVVPRGVLCDALSDALETMGEHDMALAWTQRRLALDPGHEPSIRDLVRRAAAARDPARLGDALAWILAQPKPLGELAEHFAEALGVLFELDSMRGIAVGRRALDVFGPRLASVRERLLAMADRAGDQALAIGVLERWTASDANGEEAVALLLELSKRRLAAGDFDGSARELARAAERGAVPASVLAGVDRVDQEARQIEHALGSDGMLALAEARASARMTEPDADRIGAANALRELGSLRWDLAEDPRGGEAAFYAARQIAADGGMERYAHDVAAFAGLEGAVDMLEARASLTSDDQQKERAGVLLEAANLANEAGLHERALGAAAMAIDLDPARADALALVEKAAHVDGGLEILDRTYDRLASAALGKYGRRAAHYRGARQLEKRGAVDYALRHAIACFEAVPGEGTSYVLLARLAERANDSTEVVRALERVADVSDVDHRTAWLKRAASLAGKTEEGARLRLDILLRALNVRPDPRTVDDVGRAMVELIALAGEDDTVPMRFQRAVRSSLKRLDGPDGARTAVAMARVALSFDDAATALVSLEGAMSADGDIDEYLSLAPSMATVAREPDAAKAFLAKIAAAVAQPYSSVGPALLRLASRLARELGDRVLSAELLVQAARRAPEDDALVHEADAAVREAGGAHLRKSLDDALPVARRIEALLHLAEKHEREGDAAQAIVALERALLTPDLEAEDRDKVIARLRQLFGVAGRGAEAERLLEGELGRGDIGDAARLRVGRDLAGLRVGRGDHLGALDVISTLVQKLPFDRDLVTEMAKLARRTGDARRRADAVTRLADAAPDDAARLAALRELASILRDMGDRAGALAHYEAIVRLEPGDPEALGVLEQEASDRGDFAAIAELLARRLDTTTAPETRRVLRLRRAAVLEQRLGRLGDACAELEGLLEESRDDASALRYLADIHERLGAPLRAAPLWRTLGDLAQTTDEKAELGLRASRGYLAGGDAASARLILDAIAEIAPRDAVIELRVELARRSGDVRLLSEALDQLATSSREPAEKRAAILVEASRAASALGDDAAALERARRAARLAPELAEAVLEARRLEYRVMGSGTPREAQTAVDELTRVTSSLPPELVELHAFLLAEWLDVIQGGGAGMRELSRRHAEIGPTPLIALGMAERLVRSKSFEGALPLFERALEGDLRGVRTRGRVALAAAESAVNAGETEIAARLLEEAALEPDTRTIAMRRQLELTAARGEWPAAKLALEDLATQSSGVDRGRALAQLGRLLVARDRAEALRLLREAAPLVAGDRNLSAQLVDEIAGLEAPPPGTLVPSDAPPAPPLPHGVLVAHASPAPASTPPSPLAAAAGSVSAQPLVPVPAAPVSGPPPDGQGAAPDVRAPVSTPPASAPSVPPVAIEGSATGAPTAPEPRAAAEPVTTGVPSAPEPGAVDEAVVMEPLAAQGSAQTGPGEESSRDAPRVPSEPASSSALEPFEELRSASSREDEERASQRGHRSSRREVAPAAVDEPGLLDELAGGSFEAGDRLAELYEGEGQSRAPELVSVRKHQAALRPGDRGALEKLRSAAQSDRNEAYAKSIEHVLRAFDPGARPLPPPPLASQREEPELVTVLLFKSAASPVLEALSLTIETGLYRRDPTQYGLTGVERVQPGVATVLAEVYGGVVRLLGAGRTALFHRREPGQLHCQVALLAPPALILQGELKERNETAELRYVVGAGIAGAMPEQALVNAQPEANVRALLQALIAAFGPVGATKTKLEPAVFRLEQDLWQLVPPRSERRLRELCADPGAITYEIAKQGTLQAMRRAGLFASGNLATAVRVAVAELRLTLDVPLEAPDGLSRACAAHPALADLVRLATRTEYAEVRWLSGPPLSVRRESSSRRPRAGT